MTLEIQVVSLTIYFAFGNCFVFIIPRDSGEGYSNSGRLFVCLSVCPSHTLSCLRDNLSKHG